MKKVLAIILTVIISSCSNEVNDPVLSDFDKVMNLNSSITKISSNNIGEIVDMLVYDSVLVVNEMFSNKIFKLINLNTGKVICNCIQKGKGQNEMINPNTITKYNNHIFTTYDDSKKELIYLSLTNLLNLDFSFKSVEFIDLPFSLKAYPINDTLIINTGTFKGGRYCLLNKKTKNKIIKLDYPFNEKHKSESYLIKGLVFQGQITIKPDKSKFAMASSAGDFEIVNILNNDIKRAYRKTYYLPEYESIKGYGPKYKNTRKYAFVSAFSTDKYIYVLYSGRSMKEYGDTYYHGKNLLVYNWKGQPIINFKLDRLLQDMCFEEKSMQIFGHSINPVTGEPEIIKYNLPKTLAL